jgi:hypothetical protein
VKLPGDGSLKNARLFVDDKDAGVLPQDVDVPPGEHKVTVKRAGYATYNTMVKVKETGATELTVPLEPVAGVLSVTSETVGVEVFVDGKSYGPVPLGDVVLSPGEHQVRFKREGYDEQTQALSVKAGKDYALRASMKSNGMARTDRPEKNPKLVPGASAGAVPAAGAAVAGLERGREEGVGGGGGAWYGQWFVWAGGAAVVAGGAAATYFALQPQSPCGPPGDKKCDACINAPPSMDRFCRAAAVRMPLMVGVGGNFGGKLGW